MIGLGLDLWVLRKDLEMRFFGNLGSTMTIVRLADGRVALISPVKMTDEEAQKIRQLGRVQWVISPNPLHHLYLRDAKVHFIDAELWAPAGTIEKRPDMKFAGTLGKDVALWEQELPCVRIPAKAPMIEEFIFFHRKSGTLIATDFFFNVKTAPRWSQRLALSLNGILGRFGTSRYGRMLFHDHGAVEAAFAKFKEWNPEKIVVSHGEPVTQDTKLRLSEAEARWGF